jgi:hypothetical protein
MQEVPIYGRNMCYGSLLRNVASGHRTGRNVTGAPLGAPYCYDPDPQSSGWAAMAHSQGRDRGRKRAAAASKAFRRVINKLPRQFANATWGDREWTRRKTLPSIRDRSEQSGSVFWTLDMWTSSKAEDVHVHGVQSVQGQSPRNEHELSVLKLERNSFSGLDQGSRTTALAGSRHAP